jgi:hypothetical protein
VNDASRPEVRRSFFLLSMQQVLDQLGAPDELDVEENRRVHWQYNVDGNGRKALKLTFYDGVVMNVGAWSEQ